jgi:hypothetical protein
MLAHTEGGTKAEGVRERGDKREKVTWDWRRLHNEELYALYSS